MSTAPGESPDIDSGAAAKPASAPETPQQTLKSKNNVYIWTFIGVNLAIFLSVFISKGFSSSSLDSLWKNVTAKDGILAASIPILAIVLTAVLPDVAEARIVFWRWRNPLPGSRAFTELIKKDPRIDVPALRKKLGAFPQGASEQNALWYQLYKKHADNPIILDAHRFFLLTRDMTSLSLVFALFFTIGIAIDSVGWKTLATYAAFLCLQYVLIAAAARNYGIRFVLNVLTQESQSA